MTTESSETGTIKLSRMNIAENN